MIEEALAAKLLATSGVTALTSTRIWPAGSVQAEGADRELVYVTFERISGAPHYDHGGESGLQRARVELMAHAPSYGQAKALGEALRAALSGWSETQSKITVGHCLIVANEDLYDPELRQQLNATDFECLYS